MIVFAICKLLTKVYIRWDWINGILRVPETDGAAEGRDGAGQRGSWSRGNSCGTAGQEQV